MIHVEPTATIDRDTVNREDRELVARALSEAQGQIVAEQDHAEILCKAKPGKPVVYHVGYLVMDRKEDPSAHSRALTAEGLYLMGLATLTTKKESGGWRIARKDQFKFGVYVYRVTPKRTLTMDDCATASELGATRYKERLAS